MTSSDDRWVEEPSGRTENSELLPEEGDAALWDGSQAITADKPAGFVNNLKSF